MRERRCVGRPRSKRCITGSDFRCMMPACGDKGIIEAVSLLPEEIEAIKLVDLMDMEQEDAAAMVGVSRKTLWNDIHNARKKIADAIINGKAIRMDKCESMDSDACGFDVCMKKCRGKRCKGMQAADEENAPQ